MIAPPHIATVCVVLIGLAFGATGCGKTDDQTVSTLQSRADAVVPTKPPQIPIRDPSTLQPCPKNPRTTVDIGLCEFRKLERFDAQVNARAAHVFFLLGMSGRASADRRQFVASEVAWLRYRNTECSTQSGDYPGPSGLLVGGTSAPINVALCSATLDRAHAQELARYASVICESRRHLLDRYRKGCL